MSDTNSKDDDVRAAARGGGDADREGVSVKVRGVAEPRGRGAGGSRGGDGGNRDGAGSRSGGEGNRGGAGGNGVIAKAEAVVKRFGKAAKPALDGVEITIAAGEMTGLVGPDGAGKTT